MIERFLISLVEYLIIMTGVIGFILMVGFGFLLFRSK